MDVASFKMLGYPHLGDKNFGLRPFCSSKWGLVQMGLVQLGVVQMSTFTFTFSKTSKVLIDFQYFNNKFLFQFKLRFPILYKPFFSFWYRINYVIKKTVGVVGRGLGWNEVGMDPNW